MIYLNNASTGFPKPKPVIEAVMNILNSSPVNFGRSGISRGGKNIINDTRKLLSEFLNADDDYFTVFTSGSTAALNMAVKGIDLQNKHVIISATEHNSVIRPLKTLEAETGLSISVVKCDDKGFVEPEDFRREIKENTSLVCINLCSNVTGTIQDIQQISKICKEYDIKLLVDGSQAAGVIDVDISDFKPDIFCITAHKALNGIQGCGALIFRKDCDIKPLITGGTGTLGNLLTQPDRFPEKFESGTMNIPGIAALEAGIKWINETGLEIISEHKKNLVKIAADYISDMDGAMIYYDRNRSSGSVLSMNFKDIEPSEINYILSGSFDISVRSGIHCAPLIHQYLNTEQIGTLRMSPSYFTSEDDISYFLDSLKKIVKGLRN